ncbi:hypothetical protein [uncultured Phascolarctobacterium sp.]|uniref:hypothetical protein n=1 Tax=uncultured Phascolarctobacterium sp. TaxID=512296 RepID=UPI002600C724|nr:hypothetical protein [uncultured Phascolarctobacterium sp.]
MGTTRRFLRNMDKVTLSNLGKAATLQKVVSTVTAMGFVLQPVAAMAQTVINPVKGGATVETNGQVTNVWAGTVVNDVALNVFKQFDVGANDIANMYFKEKDGNVEASNLVNMVGSRININGTVNAIHNKKIGGNLYFLSSDGIAVGAGGVVNAGTLTLMTPSDRFMKTAMAAAGTDGVLTDATNAVINIFDDKYNVDVDTFKNSYLLNNWNKFQQMEVAINKTGTITVNGTINTIDGIRMKAAHINIGKELDSNGKIIKNATAKAVLNSGIVDFKDIVNIKDTNNQVAVSAGLGNDLKATVTGDGNIVLAAVADTVNHFDDYAGAMSKNFEGNNTVQATVDIGNAELKAVKGTPAKVENATAGTIDITATATSGSGEGGILGVDIASTNAADILGGKIKKTEAIINIDGDLTTDNINVAANAENSFEKDSLTEVGGLIGKVTELGGGLIPFGEQAGIVTDNVKIGYAKLASNAEVNIGSGANLTATGNDTLGKANDDGLREGVALNISAISKLSAEVGAEVEGAEGGAGQGKAAGAVTPAGGRKKTNSLSKVMPGAGVSVVETDNNARVTVAGNLNSNGDANVSAHALSEVEAEAGVATIDSAAGSQYVNAAVVVANIDNTSSVVLNGTTQVSGELNALAAAKNEVTTTATAETTKDSLVSTAINVTNAASTADLTVGGNITAGKMNIAADNTISNEIQAATQVGKSRFQTKSQMSGGTLNAILGKTKNKGKSAKVDKIGDYISAGAAVNIVDETNSAKVTVQKGAQLTAKDSGIDDEGKAVATINISANNTIEDSLMSATSVVNNYATKRGTTSSGGTPSTGTTQTAALASVGFLQADMDNSAQVVIEGSDDQGTGAPVIKGANVNINANSAFEYDRLGSMIDSLQKDYGDIVEKYKEVPGLLTAWKDALAKSGEYLSNPSVDGAMDVAEAFQNAVDSISLKYADTAMGVPEDLQTLMEDLLAFADVSNYTNFYTAASTAGGSVLGTTSGKEQAQLSLAGSININSIKNNAQVIVGKGAQLDASVADGGSVKKGELNISAAAKQHDVALNGKTKYFIPTISNTGGGATAIGGSVGVHDADVNSLVVVGEGAKLSANDVSLKAKNDLQHTAITFGGGKATNQGITGMFAYMEGQSNSIISVDDEASISAAQNVALAANNNTTISNIIFDRTSAGGTAMGASIGIVDYKVNNIAAVADNDSDAKDGERDEVSDLRKLVNDQLSAEEKAQLGTKAAVAGEANGKGKITANAVKVNAETSGTITGVSVAGVTAGASQPNNRGTGSGFKIPAQIAGAGSASVNEISGNTAALLEGVEVTTAGTDGYVKVSASDDSMIGAYSGAAALKKKGRQANSGGFSATLAGAVAYNEVKTGVTAQIKDASIKNAKTITNQAAREGAVVAAGLALGVDTSGQGTGSATAINAGVSASINKIDNSTHAVMNNVNTSASGGDKTGIANIAQSKDIQVAGGITAQYAKGGGIGIGAAVSSLHAANDIQSRITNSDLHDVGTLKAYAQTDLVQVGTVLSAGVIQGQNGNGVQAAVADNQLVNNVNVTIEGKAINAEAIDAKAFDGEIEATTNHLNDLADEGKGFDVDGKDVMADVNATQADVSVDKKNLGAEKKDADGKEQGDDGRSVSDFKADDKKGNLIVSGAVSVIANTSSQGKVAAGAAAVNQKISNNFTTNIKGATINANTVNANAESDTLMVGATAGVAVSTGQQGVANIAGSVGVMQLDNNTTATIEDSTITADAIEAKAENKSRLINVAGQVSVSKGKVAAGLATTTNILHNTTGAYVYDSELKGEDAAKGAALTVAADNKSEAYAVAVGVAVQAGQQGAALSGDVAVNKGVNNTEAIVGKKAADKGNAIADIDKVTIKAVDSTKLKAISGGVTVSTGHAGLGGAVAYNEVGNGDSDKQSTLAKLSDTSIKTAKAATIDVQAEDKSKMLAIAVGAAVQTGQTGAAAQGCAATTILHKNVEAAVSSVDVDNDGANKQNAALNVTAKNTSEAITSADVVAFTTANFAGGAAVAVTNSDNDTKASITGGTLNLQSGKVQADSNVDIINVGIGVAAATGQGGALAGNVAVNNIKNDTLASISGAAINAKGTLGVQADSREHIRNYAGALAVTAGQGYAAGGLSTAVNVISGDTKATVSDSAITAVGDDAGITVTEYAKDKKDNKEETLTGFVVNADSAHEIDNVVITGGVAATAEFAVAGTGTVTVNTIKGETEASITGTNVNAAGAVGEKADVSVRANDNTEIDSHVGSASIAASANGGVGVGIASDSNVMSRKVTARIAGSTDKKTVNADKLTVNAFNKHDITSSTTGVAVGASAYAGVGVAGTISVVKTDAETTAEVENITSKNNGLTVNADHVNKLLAISNSAALGGAMGGASVGAGVSIVQDGSKTQAALKDSNIDHEKDNAQDSVTAHNDTDLTSSTASGAVSISIGAGVSDVITINNMDNTVQATVQDSIIGKNKQAGKITVDAANDLNTKFVAVSAAGGLVGVGMGIGVNTIDTSVVTNVIGGSMKANAVEITANENRNITQTAVSAGVGGIAGSATVMVTNIGSKVSGKYGLTSVETVDQNGNAKTTETQAEEVNISGAFTKANESATAQDKLFGDNGINSNGVLLGAGTTDLDMGTGLASADYKTGVQANKGGDTVVDKAGHKIDVQGVKINVSNANITTTGAATIKANANTDAVIKVGNAPAGATSVGSTVGLLDVKRNSGVNITGGNISANNLTVGSDQSGTATVDVHQAAASGANFGLFYSGVHLSGNNDINIKGAQLSGKNGVSITTNDTTTASLQTVGGSFALTENANIFVVDGKNESSSSTITVKSEGNTASNLTSDKGDVVITAHHGISEQDMQQAENATNADAENKLQEARSKYDVAQTAYNQASDADKASKMEALQEARNNLTEAEFNLQKAKQQAKIDNATGKATMTANIIPVAVAGVASGLGFNAMVEDSSKTKVNIGAGQTFTSNKAGGKVDINAINNSVNKVSSVTVNAALGAAIGATGVQAKGNAGSSLTVGNNNVFVSDKVNLGAEANVINDAKITAVGAGFGSFMVNWATANAATNVNVSVGDNLYKAGSVNITGKSDITQHAGATGLIAGMYTSGTNLAKVDAHDVVNVTANGNKAESQENNSQNAVNIAAEGVVNQLADSNGYGGAYVDVSPAAAITKSKINSETNANVTGNWKVNTIDVNAKHDNIVDLDTDAVKAAVVGLSGVWAFNDIVNNTNLNLTGAAITANGDVNAKALNDISYRNKIWAGGYGAVAGNALIADDDITLNAKVNVGDEQDAAKNAVIASKAGAINIAALTDGGTHDKTGRPLATVKKEVVIKSAGVVAGSLAFSSDDVNINNIINVNAGSKLETQGSANNQSANNVTLSAADRVNYIDEATADTQGGVVGAASTDMDVTMNRANAIKVAGTIDSNYDAIFDAGDSSVLNMVLKSNAYNKTAAPLVANPALDYSLNQTNSINLQQGSTVKSTRNIELAATTGNTTLATQSQSWKWTDGGLTGNASLASTADGNGTKVGNSNNTVTVDGTAVAGKNNELTITIKDASGGQKALEDEIKANENKQGTISQETIDALNTSKANYDQALKAKEDAEQAVSKLNVELTKLEGQINDAGTKNAELESVKNTAETAKNNALTVKNSTQTNRDRASSALDTNVNTLYKQYYSSGTETDVAKKKEWIDTNIDNLTDADKKNYNDLVATLKTAQSLYAAAEKEYNDKNAKYTEAKANYDANLKLITKGDAARTSKQQQLAAAKATAAKYADVNSYESKNLAKLLKEYQAAQKVYNEAEEEASGATKINTLVFGTGENLGKNLDGSKAYVDITANDWYVKANGSPAENVKLQNYAVRLTDKLAEINNMIQEYAGTEIEKVYKAERTRIYTELQALGLCHYDEALKQYVVNSVESTVPTVELKNITVTGGNVNIQGDKLNGTGTITANGNPNVTINNESSYFLKVKDITVDGEGGKVKLNNVTTSQADHIQINAKRGDLISDAIGDNAKVTINVSDKANASKNENFTPDVGVVGTISNPYGTVNIDNKAGSIYVTGEGSIKGRSIELKAKGNITQGYTDGIYNVGSDPSKAVSSDVIEKIQAGIVNSIADISQTGKYYTAFSSVENLAKFLYYNGIGSTENEATTIAKALTGENQEANKGIFAGGAVYINAASINVNGTIQSGYDTFKLEMKNSAVNNTILMANGAQLKDNDSYRSDAYLVSSKSGAEYEDGKFVYKIKAWYNPYTQEIFTEDIDQSGGGRIYLTGAIANTNSKGGKLLALDGGATIDIDTNAKGIKLQVGKINADNVEGQITIVDTATQTPTITVYKRSGNEKIIINDTEQSGTTATYKPQNQMYQFTNGETSQVITSYTHVRDSKWFGLDVDHSNTQSMKDDKDNISFTSTITDGVQTARNDIIDNGSTAGYDYLGTKGYNNTEIISGVTVKVPVVVSSEKNSDTVYQITLDRYVNPDGKESEKVVHKNKKGLLGIWGSKTTTTWTETQGSVSAYNYGIKADNPIEIGFIGDKSGSTVNITGAKDVTLAGDIRAGSVNVKANNGSIVTGVFDSAIANQQKTIYTDNLDLTATNGNIKVLQQGVDKALDLKASAGENITIKTLAGIKTGDVYLDNINAGGDIQLTIEGQALKSSRSTYATRSANNANTETKLIAGGKLILNAANGIGEAGNEHIIQVGEFASLFAESGDIWAKQDGTEAMKLKQVEAKNGDVHLEAKGGFVDVIDDNTVTTSNENAAIADWKKLGLLGDDGVTEGLQNSKETQINNLKSQADNFRDFGSGESNALVSKGNALVDAVQSQFDDYMSKQSTMYTAQGNLNEAVSALNKSETEANKSAYNAALAAYNQAFGEYAQAKNTYETAKSDWISNNIGSLTTNASLAQKAEGWLNSYETVQHSASSAHQWTARELMYAVQDSIINPKAGTITDVSKANVIGNNITLKTDGSFGVKDTQKTEIKIANMFKYNENGTLANDATSEADLKKLAAARADDVTWGTDTIVIERTTPVTVELNKKADGTFGNVKLETVTNGKVMENIYLIGKDSALNIDQVIASGDVHLLAHKGIHNSKNTGDLNIIGKDITLEGGSGNIGSSTQAVLAGLLGGKINANAAGDIYLKQMTNKPAGVSNEVGTLNTDMVLGSLAAKNITVDATNNIVSGIDKVYDQNGNLSEANSISYINASDTLKLKTANGSVGTDISSLRIKNSGGVVEIDAHNGAYLEAKGDGTLVLGEITTGDASFNVNSEGGLTMQRAEERDAENNVVKSAVKGSINDGKAAQNINLTAADDIKLNGKVNAEGKKLQVTSYAGDISQGTSAEADNIVAANATVSAVQGSIALDNIKNKIDNLQILTLGKDFTLSVNQENLNLSVDNVVNNYGGNFAVNNFGGAISITNANANIYGDISISAKDNISVDANSRLTTNELNSTTSNDAVLKQKGNITLTAGAFDGTEGSITNNGSIVANAVTGKDTEGNAIGGTANVTFNAEKGGIENTGTITATASDVNDADGNVVKAGNASIIMNAKTVTNNNTGALAAKTNIDIDATNGNAVNNGTLNAGNDIDVDATGGNIANNGTAEAGQNVDLNASGDVTTSANGKITSGNDTKLSAGNDVTTNGKITSGKDAKLNAGNNITTNGAITSAGNTSLNAKGTGAIEVNGTVNADGSISGTAENGPITIGAAMDSKNGGIALKTNKDITINGALHSANGDIKADSKQGNIETNAEITVDTGNVEQAAQGNIDNNANITVENGNINEEADGYIKSKDNGNTPITLKAINGSINIKADGEINLYEVIANNGKADIESANGNIYLRNVNGKEVILVTKSGDAKLKAEKVIAGKLTTRSDDTDLGISFDVQVRDDGYIEIGELTGNDGNSAVKNLNLKVTLGDLGKGVIINKLWAENANLKLADGTLAIDKLAVENRADFDVNSMTTTVFGVPPQRTGSDSIYWFNVDDFKNNNAWMKLIFSKTKHVQSSDGVLLQLRDYYYAYDQRFTAVDHLNQLLAENKADEYDINFTPNAALFLRYDLYDVHDSVHALADDDDAEKIIIES